MNPRPPSAMEREVASIGCWLMLVLAFLNRGPGIGGWGVFVVAYFFLQGMFQLMLWSAKLPRRAKTWLFVS